MNTSRKRTAADRAASAGGAVAGSVGAVFGAAKLRDAHAKDFPERHAVLIRRAEGVLRKVPDARRAKIVGTAAHGNPNFHALAAATAAGVLAASADKYARHLSHVERKEQRRTLPVGTSSILKSAFGIDHGTG